MFTPILVYLCEYLHELYRFLLVRSLKFSPFNFVYYEIHEFFIKTSHIKWYLIKYNSSSSSTLVVVVVVVVVTAAAAAAWVNLHEKLL